MVLITQSGPETLSMGSPAPDFSLPATDGSTVSFETFADSKAIVLNFTCNHCPYAKAYFGRYNDLAKAYLDQGVAFAAICANDAENYPDDSFAKMKVVANEESFPFPYLCDESQDVAKAYGAVCTPHLFVLDADRNLVYEGRIDDNWQEPGSVKSQDLRDAIQAVLDGNPVPAPQTNPMGCSIKWKS